MEGVGKPPQDRARLMAASKKSKGNRSGNKTPWWKQAATGAVVVLGAVGGGSGLVAIVDAVQGPEVPPQSCVSYWEEVREAKEAGFNGFVLLVDSELEDRCGDANEVARSWE
jgi:hypothetical protein